MTRVRFRFSFSSKKIQITIRKIPHPTPFPPSLWEEPQSPASNKKLVVIALSHFLNNLYLYINTYLPVCHIVAYLRAVWRYATCQWKHHQPNTATEKLKYATTQPLNHSTTQPPIIQKTTQRHQKHRHVERHIHISRPKLS